MDINLSVIISIISLLLTILAVIGGAMVYRSALAQATNAVQETTITAMQAQIATLKDQVSGLNTDNQRLTLVQSLIIETLEKRGITLTVEKTSIIIQDKATQTNIITRIVEQK